MTSPRVSTSAHPSDEVKFSGIVVTYNEEKYLARCLESLSFCDELLVVDLGSTDRCREIARAADAAVLCHPWRPVVEEVRTWAVDQAKYDWVYLVDPDECVGGGVPGAVAQALSNSDRVALIRVACKFLFRGRALTTTMWGWDNYRTSVIHRRRVHLPTGVHLGPQPLDGFEKVRLSGAQDCVIEHRWIDSYREYFAKHKRYLAAEGRARFEKGGRFSLRRAMRDTIRVTVVNLWTCRGWRGGIHGWFLSIGWSTYTLLAWFGLRGYERRAARITRHDRRA